MASNSQQLLPVDGDSGWPLGMNSALHPLNIPPGTYSRAWNVLNRNGVISTRPGYRWKAALPKGKIQGRAIFKPLYGLPQEMVAVAGRVYVSSYPYDRFYQLPNIRFSSRSDIVYFEQAQQSTTLNPDQSVRFISPKAVMFMQDGVAPSAFYDGHDNGHNTGIDRTPQGGPMCWSGDRLWVATRNKISASNITDPFNFTERFTLGKPDDLFLEDQITAMVETAALSGTPQLLAFTASTGTAIQSNQRQRSTWTSTPNFQFKVFQDVGCTSARSICTQFGILWWWSARGLQNLNFALQSRLSSRTKTADSEMSFSKKKMDQMLHQVAIGTYDDFLLVSVPYGGPDNQHTWVLDNAVIRALEVNAPPVWSSVWTGISPKFWSTPNVNGADRAFVYATDANGNNAMWEAFRGDTDNGQPIEAAVELRAYNGQTTVLKRARVLETTFVGVRGPLDVTAFFRPSNRGPYRPFLSRRVNAQKYPVLDMTQTLTPDTVLTEGGEESRVYRSVDLENPAEVTDAFASAGIELPLLDRIDFSFEHIVRWVGAASLSQTRWFAEQEPERNTGEAGEETEKPSFVQFDGQASFDPAALAGSPSGVFTASATVQSTARGMTASATASARSLVSQPAALRIAQGAAAAQADHVLLDEAPKVYSQL